MDFVEFMEAFAYIAEKAGLYYDYDPTISTNKSEEERKALPFHLKLEGSLIQVTRACIKEKLIGRWNIPTESIFDENNRIKEEIFA